LQFGFTTTEILRTPGIRQSFFYVCPPCRTKKRITHHQNAAKTKTAMEMTALQKQQSDKLIYYGILLFLLGLVVGLFVPLMANPRMGLSSHLEGIMNGLFLIALGLIWGRVDLSAKWLNITFWLAIYGTFANWFGILLAAVLNAGKMLNIAAKGQEGDPLSEGIVTFFLVTLSLAMLFICVAVLIGLKKHMNANS
jgi:(hydroxyamino)benzene mutase